MAKAPEHVEDFQVGDAVPEWLVFVTPTSKEANRGSPRFAVDCSLYRINGALWLIPRDMAAAATRGLTYVRFDNAQDVHISSAEDHLFMPLTWYELYPAKENLP